MCLTRKNRKKSDRKLLNDADIIPSISIGKSPYFPGSRAGEIFHISEVFMKTGLTKKQKITELFYNAKDPFAEIYTHDTQLKKRLKAYATKYPELCKQTDDDEHGGLWFEIDKRRISIRLTAPYSKERRNNASHLAKEINTFNNADNGIHKNQ